jgi:hypothetical protein
VEDFAGFRRNRHRFERFHDGRPLDGGWQPRRRGHRDHPHVGAANAIGTVGSAPAFCVVIRAFLSAARVSKKRRFTRGERQLTGEKQREKNADHRPWLWPRPFGRSTEREV